MSNASEDHRIFKPKAGAEKRRTNTLRADVLSATREALQTPEVRRSMARAVFAFGAALAVVAALGVHASLHAIR
jgi:hypothetical protein